MARGNVRKTYLIPILITKPSTRSYEIKKNKSVMGKYECKANIYLLSYTCTTNAVYYRWHYLLDFDEGTEIA